MQYLLLIHAQESAWGTMTEAERARGMAAYMEFTKSIQQSKNYVNSNRLQPTSATTTVRVRDGKATRTHGPFAETREQLGGYFLIEAKDDDEAYAIAERCPGAHHGTVEVRPVATI